MKRLPLAGLTCLVVILSGCSPEDPEAQIVSGPCTLPPEDVESIRTMETNHGAQVLNGDFDGMQADLAEDVVVIFPNQTPIIGRVAVREFQGGFPPIDEYEFLVEEIFGCGDMALARGTYSMAMSVEGTPETITDSGNWMHILRKQSNGRWIIVRDMGNSDRPAT
jgi:ketosteroid isomerase-like protein